jgi:acyl-coenzyme A synthetase/AMP-(fatty) acid ligase
LQADGVAYVAVVSTPDAIRDEAIVAFVVRDAGAAVEATELFALCDASVAPYKVPQFIEFVDELPRNFVGKVERRVLREHALKYRIDGYDRLPVGYHAAPGEEGAVTRG